MAVEDSKRPINLDSIVEKTSQTFDRESGDAQRSAGNFFRERMKVFLEVHAGDLPDQIQFRADHIGWRGQVKEQEYTLETNTGILQISNYGEARGFQWYHAREAIVVAVQSALPARETGQ